MLPICWPAPSPADTVAVLVAAIQTARARLYEGDVLSALAELDAAAMEVEGGVA